MKNILRKCHWSKYASNYFYVTRRCWYLRNVSLQSNLSSHLVTFKIKSSFQVIKLVSQVNRGRLWRIIVWHHAWCAHPVPRWIWEFELFQMIYGAQLRAFTLPVFNNCDAIVPLHGAGLHRVNLDWRPTGKRAIRILSSLTFDDASKNLLEFVVLFPLNFARDKQIPNSTAFWCVFFLFCCGAVAVAALPEADLVGGQRWGLQIHHVFCHLGYIFFLFFLRGDTCRVAQLAKLRSLRTIV